MTNQQQTIMPVVWFSFLELARILNSHAISSTVVLLFSTGEEEGTLGVQSYVDQLSPEELSAINM